MFLEVGIDLSGTRRGADFLVSAKLPAAAKIKARDATTMISFLCVMRITLSRIMVVSLIDNAPFDISYAIHHRPTAVKLFETLGELSQQISYLLRRSVIQATVGSAGDGIVEC